ncbi:hypothetical protein [Mycobacterium paraffinicum]|uniref:hypothetical protein n=1 Tax=Mycobacterium paraffinicum TaxID=53378 RepID=UPI001ABF7D7F|nr:hypothetical protein [Mycobacterium paraffinicum]
MAGHLADIDHNEADYALGCVLRDAQDGTSSVMPPWRPAALFSGTEGEVATAEK